MLPWAKTGSSSPYYLQSLEALVKQYGGSMSTPWEKLPAKVRDVILHGSNGEPVTFVFDDGIRSYKTTKPFEGVLGNIERRWRETNSAWVREELSQFQSDHPCEACKGYRLKPQALAVKVAGLHIGQVSEMSIRQAKEWFGGLPAKLKPKEREIAHRILKEIRDRLKFLDDVGPRISHAVAHLRHPVGRREPADPAGIADRLGPYRRALCAGRAVDRPPSARQ